MTDAGKYYFNWGQKSYSIDLKTNFSTYYKQSDTDCRFIGVPASAGSTVDTHYRYGNGNIIYAQDRNYITEITLTATNPNNGLNGITCLTIAPNFKFKYEIFPSDIAKIVVKYSTCTTGSGQVLTTITKTYSGSDLYSYSSNILTTAYAGTSLSNETVIRYDDYTINLSNPNNVVFCSNTSLYSSGWAYFEVTVYFNSGTIITTKSPKTGFSRKTSISDYTVEWNLKYWQNNLQYNYNFDDESGTGRWFELS